jgi:hypothetical protein
MARTMNTAPHAARSAADVATDPAPAPVALAADHGPAAAVLAALSAEPGGVTVSVIAGISTAAARQALLAHEKARTATRPGALRDLVEEHPRKFPDAAFTPHQDGKVLTRSAEAVANALDKLVSLGVAQMVTDKPRTYRLAVPTPAPDAAGDPRHQRGGCA